MTSARVHLLGMEMFQASARLHISALSSDNNVLDNIANRQSLNVILTMLGISTHNYSVKEFFFICDKCLIDSLCNCHFLYFCRKFVD